MGIYMPIYGYMDLANQPTHHPMVDDPAACFFTKKSRVEGRPAKVTSRVVVECGLQSRMLQTTARSCLSACAVSLLTNAACRVRGVRFLGKLPTPPQKKNFYPTGLFGDDFPEFWDN